MTKDFFPVFKVFKQGVTTDGPVTILRKADEAYDVDAKRKFYLSLGYTITELTPEQNGTNKDHTPA